MDQVTIFATTESHTEKRHDQSERDWLRERLADMSIRLNNASFERAYRRVQQAESRLGFLNDQQLKTIIEEATAGSDALEGVAESFR